MCNIDNGNNMSFVPRPVKTIGLHQVEDNLASIIKSCSIDMDVFVLILNVMVISFVNRPCYILYSYSND